MYKYRINDFVPQSLASLPQREDVQISCTFHVNEPIHLVKPYE